MDDGKRQEERNRKGMEPAETVDKEDAGQDISPEEGCADALARKEEEIRQLQDRVLRLAAEADNTRKRLEREKSEGICFANESLIRELLPVIDNLERAIEHARSDADVESLLEGVQMTAKAFLDVLAKFGCVPFESLGKPFDPNFHEAVSQQDAPGQPEKTVIQEYQKGYLLNDRLLRPAMVVVSK